MRRILLVALLASVGVAPNAGAQSIVASATPNLAGKPTTLSFKLNALAAPVGGRLPKSLTMSAPGGFSFNPKAAPRRCSHEKAILGECPKLSRIGSGSLVVGVTEGSLRRNASFTFRIYLAGTTKVYLVAFIEGVRVVPGTIAVTPEALTLAFSPLPTPYKVAGVSYTLKTISLSVGGVVEVLRRRTVTRTVRVHGKAKRVKRVVLTHRRYPLVSAPSLCEGSWNLTATLGFADGSNTPLGAAIACAS